MTSTPLHDAQTPLSHSATPRSAFGAGLPSVVMIVFGFIWLGWGFSANAAFTDFALNRALPATRWISFYVAFLVLLGLALQTLRREKVKMKTTSVQRAEFWSRTAPKLKLVSMLEGSGCALVVFLCVMFHRTDLLAAGISLVVGLHFLPLASLTRVRAYYAAGSVIILGDVLSIALLRSDAITFCAGVATGGVLWITAIYTLLRSRKTPPDIIVS